MIPIRLFGVLATLGTDGVWYCIDSSIELLLRAHQATFRPPIYSPRGALDALVADVVKRFDAEVLEVVPEDTFDPDRVY